MAIKIQKLVKNINQDGFYRSSTYQEVTIRVKYKTLWKWERGVMLQFASDKEAKAAFGLRNFFDTAPNGVLYKEEDWGLYIVAPNLDEAVQAKDYILGLYM